METNNVKRLYRSKTNRTIAGICGGLGEYFDIDPVAIRLGWVVITLISGVIPGIVAYLIAIFIVPSRPDTLS